VDDPGKKRRRLPSLYVGTSQIHAHRELESVVQRLRDALAVTLSSSDRSIFALHACRIGGQTGLYGRDFFNRDPFRRKLIRMGAIFAPTSYVEISPAGYLRTEGWGSFVPEFIIIGGNANEPEEVDILKGGYLRFLLGTYRVGILRPQDLVMLGSILSDTVAMGAEDPRTIYERVTGG
jgi:hypothetical protein